MINILSYVGMSLQSEVCLWTLMGLIRTIFDATLFKVNANLKQVWQMNMPFELATSVQRVIRIVISGVMLVQCFTVYVYLASYIVLLYPVFLEERPALVLPWLLLAAVRQLLCELTSLALGLGICVLMGPSRPPCIKFVITKIATIMPSLYMWMVVLSFYHSLKVAAVFKSFPAVLPSLSRDYDYGFELAIRRRCTKSLFNEQMLRKKLLSNYDETRQFSAANQSSQVNCEVPSLANKVERVESNIQLEVFQPNIATAIRENSDLGTLQDGWYSDIIVPRDADRILEQIVLMLIRVSLYLKSEGGDCYKLFDRTSVVGVTPNYIDCSTLANDVVAESPTHSYRSSGATSSYLTDFPQIFQKRQSESLQLLSQEQVQNKTSGEYTNSIRTSYRSVSFAPGKEISIEIEKSMSCKTITSRNKSEDTKAELKSVVNELNKKIKQAKKSTHDMQNNETISNTINNKAKFSTDRNSSLNINKHSRDMSNKSTIEESKHKYSRQDKPTSKLSLPNRGISNKECSISRSMRQNRPTTKHSKGNVNKDISK